MCANMKTSLCTACLLATVLVLALGRPAGAASSAVGAAARFHQEHSAYEDYPFTDGDVSYGLTYEYHEASAYWQLALLYADGAGPSSSTNTIDYVITPQASLMFKDGPWRGGVGALASLVEDEVAGSDWTDIYWQFILGVSFPVMGFHLDGRAFYVFEDWSEVESFDFDDIEYGVGLTYYF